LTFNFPILASMLTGKKVMYIDAFEAFDFFPGESVVMPTNKKVMTPQHFKKSVSFSNNVNY